MITNSHCYALIVLKPDALKQCLGQCLIEAMSSFGLNIVKTAIRLLTPEQVAILYEEKRGYNYFPLLVDFMSRSPSMLLIVNTDRDQDATERAKDFRDWARNNRKVCNFELTEEDMSLLNEGKGIHPLQKEITRVMALENLVHVADDFSTQRCILKELLRDGDLEEIKQRDSRLSEYLADGCKQTYLLPEGVCLNNRERVTV
jgi:hypothetical protein